MVDDGINRWCVQDDCESAKAVAMARARITRFPGDGQVMVMPIDTDNWVYRRFVEADRKGKRS